MFKTFLNGVTGKIHRWNQAKWRIQTLLLKNAEKWSIADGFQIGPSQVRPMRDVLCAGINSTIDIAGELFGRFDEDFGTRLEGEILIRDWFATLHLGALLHSAATYRENVGADTATTLTLVVALHGHAAIYDLVNPISNQEWQAILDSERPTYAQMDYIMQRILHHFGPPKHPNAMIAQIEATVQIADRTLDHARKPHFSLIVDSWIYQANAGLIGKQ